MASATDLAAPPLPPSGRACLRPAPAWPTAAHTAACAVVVVHFRDVDATIACLDALQREDPRLPVVVVDHDGAMEPEPALAARCRRGPVALLVAGQNGGFGAGCNAGIDVMLAAAPRLAHVLLLNPDARVAPGAVARLLATAAAHPDAGVVGGRVLAADGRTVQFENGVLRPWTLSRMHVPAPPGDAPFPTTFVTGACMLLDAALLRAGLRFDERFFLYAEDLDLCCEVRARGRSLWVDPRAVVHHEGGGTWSGGRVLGSLTAGQVYWLARSKALFAKKRLPWPQRTVALLVAAVLKPLAGLLVARSARFLGPHWRGLWHGLWHDRVRARG